MRQFKGNYIRAFTLQFIINIDRATVVTNPSKTSIQYKNVLINIGDNLSIVAKIQKKFD
jgi:hypothetical protein